MTPQPQPSTGRPAIRSPRRFLLMLALAAAVVAVDQLTKLWAASALADRQPVPVIGDLIMFRLTYNPGAAFSIGKGNTWIFTLVAVAVVVGIVVYARRLASRTWALALGLVLGGATTHLLDRLFRAPGFARGHVLDFIDYAGFFIGNVADIALTVGVLVMVLLMLRGVGVDGERAPDETDRQGETDRQDG